jgi:hypothetical protein
MLSNCDSALNNNIYKVMSRSSHSYHFLVFIDGHPNYASSVLVLLKIAFYSSFT